MHKTIILLFLITVTSSRFLEEKLDFTIKIDFQGLKRCMKESDIENKINEFLIKKIDSSMYVDAALLSLAQLKKGNQIMKKCKRFLPEVTTLVNLYKSTCGPEPIEVPVVNSFSVQSTIPDFHGFWCFLWVFGDSCWENQNQNKPKEEEREPAVTEAPCGIVLSLL